MEKQVSQSGVSHQGASCPYPKDWGGKTPHFLPRFYPENQAGTQALKRRVLSPPNRCWTYKGGQRPGRKEGKAPRGSPMNQPAVRCSRNAVPRPRQWALFPRAEEASHRPRTRLPQDQARGTAPGSCHRGCSTPSSAHPHVPARLLTVPTAPSPSRTLPGGRRRDVTNTRRLTANGKSQKGVGGTLLGSPSLLLRCRQRPYLQQGSSVFPVLHSQALLLGGAEGAGAVHLF